jgi:hypothetical protein
MRAASAGKESAGLLARWPPAESAHVGITLLLAVLLIPAMHALHLPARFDWSVLLQTFWVAFSVQSIVAASLLFVLAFPLSETLKPMWARYSADKRRLILLVPFLLFLYLLCTVWASAWLFPFVAFLALTVLELVDRSKTKPRFLASWIRSLLFPSVYLFCGLVLVSAYNDIAVASRPYVTYDAQFNGLDHWILAGASVSGIAHYAFHNLPPRVYQAVEFVYYYCMFPQVGAALLWMAVGGGRKEAFRLTAALLTGYYLAIGIFWLWPSQGPFLLCSNHFSDFPSGLRTNVIQGALLAQANSLWTGRGIDAVRLDYYIAFPSMHIAILAIVAVYLRRWKRIFWSLLLVDALVALTVILLEWHYAIDILGGLAVGGIAVLLFPAERYEPTRRHAVQHQGAMTPSVTKLVD